MQRQAFFIILSFLLFIICISCDDSKKYDSLSVEEFSAILQNEEPQLVDVRTGVEYSEGHIPDAININVLDESFEKHVDDILETDLPVAVYCRTGNRSKKAADILVAKGYKVYELDGGITAWEKESREIEK